MREDLTSADSHFAFGKNWAAYARKIGEAEIAEAQAGLSRLLGGERLDGKRVLDIGCGSGLHSLAALRLGAAEVVAVDIDSDSVATTRALLERESPNGKFSIKHASVFDLRADTLGAFDLVYSWGVLHHTGNMDRAIRGASELVKPGGQLIFALYRKTWMCGFWKREKRWYAKASPHAQMRARAIYVALFRLGMRLTGRRFEDYVRNYRSNRGMDFYHDVHDWMGGYPYESISPAEVESLMQDLGLHRVRVFAESGRVFGRNSGVFGSGCDEYVYGRP